MSIKTTKFGHEIVKACEEVMALGYRAGNKNRYGKVLEEVVKEYDSKTSSCNQNNIGCQYTGAGKKQNDYCAITVSVILDRATQKYKRDKNASSEYRSPAASYFLTNLKGKVTINNTPAPGCLFVIKRSGGSGYHVGVVWQLINNGNSIQTVEGNTYCSSCYIIDNEGCATKLNPNEYGILTRRRPTKKVYKFIHIEELYDNDIIARDLTDVQYAGLADGKKPDNACDIAEFDENAIGGEESNIDNKYIYYGIGAVVIGGLIYYIFNNK